MKHGVHNRFWDRGRPGDAPVGSCAPGPGLSGHPGRPEGGLRGLPPYASPAAEVLLDLCFRELVKFYRHSGCGRLCRGLAHRMNSPLQVLSLQLELLEKKSLEELGFLPEVRSPAGEKLQALHHYRLQKVRQFRRSWKNSRRWCAKSS